MSQRSRPHICLLPPEITSYVVEQLDVETTFHLALSCRRFWDFVHDNSVCEKILKVSSPGAVQAVWGLLQPQIPSYPPETCVLTFRVPFSSERCTLRC